MIVYTMDCIDTNGDSIPNFYIFKNKSRWIFHFIVVVQACGGNMSTNNKHLLILGNHNFDTIVDVI
jgi:hypothetical protein